MMTVENIDNRHNKVCVQCNINKSRKDLDVCEKCRVQNRRRNRVLNSYRIKCQCSPECTEMIYSITISGKKIRMKQGHSMNGKKHTEETRKKIRMTHRPMPKKSSTLIEKIVRTELEKHNILFFLQKGFIIIDFIHSVDILIPPNICIELDGEYWHTKIIKDNYSPINRDYIVDAELEKQGYKVYRFWDKDIYNNLEWVMNQIFKIIGKNYQTIPYIQCKCGCGTLIRKYDPYGRKRTHMKYHGTRKNMSGRQCVLCGSEKTLIKPNGRPRWERFKDGFLCTKCAYKETWKKIKSKKSIS